MGTVVKSSEDDDPFALLTAFNAARVRGQEWARQLRAYLAARCPDEATKRKLEEVGRNWGSLSAWGLWLQERRAQGLSGLAGAGGREEGSLELLVRMSLAVSSRDFQCRLPLCSFPRQALESPATGLLVSERLINCPPQLAPPLLQFLLEVRTAVTKSSTGPPADTGLDCKLNVWLHTISAPPMLASVHVGD